MDAFEKGRKTYRDKVAEAEVQMAEKEQNRRSTSQRLYKIIAPKLEGLGYEVWVGNEDLYVSRWKPSENSIHYADLHFSTVTYDPKLTDIEIHSKLSWRMSNQHPRGLTDEEVLVWMGQYYEVTKDDKTNEENKKKRDKIRQEEKIRELQKSHPKVFKSNNWGWGWGVIALIILWIIF